MTDFTRESALKLVFAEAFSKHGIGILSGFGEDVGYYRMARLIAALNFLAEELSEESQLDRQLVSALTTLTVHVPDSFPGQFVKLRSSLREQIGNLVIAATWLVGNWDNWPEMPDYDNFDFTIVDEESLTLPEEQCEGYRVGDITYCDRE